LPKLHDKGELQSLLIMHPPPTSIFFAELQPATSQDDVTTKPRTRDADISILQFVFWLRPNLAAAKSSRRAAHG
jgi:hypothetical protein